jgi:O-antigen ligase
VLVFGITFSNATVEVCVGLTIFLFFIKRIILKKIKLPSTPINSLFFIFFIIVFVSFLRSGYPKESLKGFLRLPRYFFLFFSLIDFFYEDKKRLDRFFWAIVGISGFTFLNGIFQNIVGFDILRHHTIEKLDYLHRINASFVHPNDFGAFIIFVLPLTFAFLNFRLSREKRAILLAACLLGLYCLARTSSRSAWIGFLVGMAVYFFFSLKKKKYFFIPLIVMIVLIFLSPHGFSRVMSLFSLEKNTVWERIQLWKGTWNMVRKHPMLGFGINTFSTYFPQYKPPDYPDVRYAHNSYLQLWSEIGITGLLVFLSIVFTVFCTVFYRLKEKISREPEGMIFLGLIAGYIGFLIQSAFDTNLNSLVLTFLFWTMTAYIISFNKHLKEKIHA